MAAHEAGELHAPGYGGVTAVPSWLRPPTDANELLPTLWPGTAARDLAGVLTVGGVDVATLAGRFGTPAFILDEVDFRGRALAFAEAFSGAFGGLAGAGVHYASKAFTCTGVARWIAEDGLGLDVCSAVELAIGLRGGVPAERITLHGNNKPDGEIRRALEAGIGRIAVDSLAEIDRVADIAGELGVRARVLLRITVGVEAHTHEYVSTAHEDQKFGLSLSGGVADEGIRRVLARPELELRGLHSHIGSQIFDTGGFEVAARRLLTLHARTAIERGYAMPEIDLGGGYGIAYTSAHDPLEPKTLADQMAELMVHECRALGIDVPRVTVEPGRAIAGPSTFTLYRVGTVKDVQLDSGATRRYVSVDGGMSDNIRTALYGADYSCTLASRASSAPAVLSRVVGRHCESGDVVVRDEFLPGDAGHGDLLAVPGTGAYCRSMASNYNQVPRPPVVSVRDRKARVLVRRETEEDLLALDEG
ncbi:MAG: diaminopimelate decarboxylase [Actinomycetota bacterium]|nr:diaminopimelate decarboxylase [Actinomycetota bacterium]